ncbi:hypothetical protein VP01_510g10 [Puccinia sorghi]|uniref:Uncharacterized protein n=1 Tax=Puccinia sorghi TaxID=27349 RepID=A0A0L6UL64_9BASI|nr:hypothetical protein VP01_510g10 [Puccinia sorghi]
MTLSGCHKKPLQPSIPSPGPFVQLKTPVLQAPCYLGADSTGHLQHPCLHAPLFSYYFSIFCHKNILNIQKDIFYYFSRNFVILTSLFFSHISAAIMYRDVAFLGKPRRYRRGLPSVWYKGLERLMAEENQVLPFGIQNRAVGFSCQVNRCYSSDATTATAFFFRRRLVEYRDARGSRTMCSTMGLWKCEYGAEHTCSINSDLILLISSGYRHGARWGRNFFRPVHEILLLLFTPTKNSRVICNFYHSPNSFLHPNLKLFFFLRCSRRNQDKSLINAVSCMRYSDSSGGIHFAAWAECLEDSDLAYYEVIIFLLRVTCHGPFHDEHLRPSRCNLTNFRSHLKQMHAASRSIGTLSETRGGGCDQGRLPRLCNKRVPDLMAATPATSAASFTAILRRTSKSVTPVQSPR